MPSPKLHHRLLARLSIRFTIPALLATPTILACILLIYLSVSRARTAVDRLVVDTFDATHDRVAERINEIVGMPQRLNELNLRLLRLGKLDAADLASWRPLLHQQARVFDFISCMSWDGADGRHAWITRYPGGPDLYFAVNNQAGSRQVVERRCLPDGSLEEGAPRTYDIDPREFAPFKAGAKADSFAWSEPFDWVSEDGSILTRALANVVPVRDEAGKLEGVLTAQFTLHDISTFLSGQGLSPGGRIFILDTQGHLLADSRLYPALDLNRKPVLATEAKDGVIVAATAAAKLDPANPTSFLVRQQKIFSFEGKPWILVATPFHHPSGLRWITVTAAPESDFLGDVNKTRRDGALIALAIALGTILFGILLAFFVLRPMIALTNYLRLLGEGELDARIDLPYAREFRQIADALNRTAASLKEHLKLTHDVNIADEIQRSLLPASTPDFPGLELAAFGRFCDKTGGDYYDFFLRREGDAHEMVIAIGDVVGHGLPSAMMMATTRGLLRSRSEVTNSVADMLIHANRHLLGEGEMTTGRFMTLLLLHIDAGARTLRFASAGHDSPIAYDAATKTFPEIDGGDLPLGILANTKYLDHPMPELSPGSVLLLGTDGLWEARSPAGQMLGKERLREVIAANASRPAKEIVAALWELSERHRGGIPLKDDLTIVLAKLSLLGTKSVDLPCHTAAEGCCGRRPVPVSSLVESFPIRPPWTYFGISIWIILHCKGSPASGPNWPNGKPA
ncbi:MAG: SpoIIE family protein phosphatase [Planctomycetota bacterium]|nr:SpoIIE family protein phosphatase [Planctomycetota bacterium]